MTNYSNSTETFPDYSNITKVTLNTDNVNQYIFTFYGDGNNILCTKTYTNSDRIRMIHRIYVTERLRDERNTLLEAETGISREERYKAIRKSQQNSNNAFLKLRERRKEEQKEQKKQREEREQKK